MTNKHPPEQFTSRWGLILTVLGMAVGTGNIWRFPRVAAENGGGAFLIVWILALFLWAIPVLIVEMGMGKTSGRGILGSFRHFLGDRGAWLGGFVACCALGIMFYYAVVMGWCLRFFCMSLIGAPVGSAADWEAFTSGWLPVLFQGGSLLIAVAILYGGVVRGIERANRILIPALFGMLIFCAWRAVQLPGAGAGLEFLFAPEWQQLRNPRVWLEGLTQSAWSVGAGWGLAMTYGAYMRKEDDIVLNCVTIGLGNNAASLLAGIAVLCTVYAVAPADQIGSALSGSEGLAFIWLPQLFARIPGGQLFQTVFFLTMTCAALSSIIAMIEMGARILMDFGWQRKSALCAIAGTGFLFGLPSALSLTFFQNQDWVWGLGLLISGLLIVGVAIKSNITRFREQVLNTAYTDLWLGPWFDTLVRWLVPASLATVLGWWFYRSVTEFDPDGWWNPLHPFSVATILVQWGAVFLGCRLLNQTIIAKLSPKDNT